MSTHAQPGDASPVARRKNADARRARAARKAVIAGVGTELMNAWNQGRTDPSDLATHGHDTASGYEFSIERDGAVISVSLTRDWESEG